MSSLSMNMTPKEAAVMKALLDKATQKPAKLVTDGTGYRIVCPVCNNKLITEDRYCPKCGQRIDDSIIALSA